MINGELSTIVKNTFLIVYWTGVNIADLIFLSLKQHNYNNYSGVKPVAWVREATEYYQKIVNEMHQSSHTQIYIYRSRVYK